MRRHGTIERNGLGGADVYLYIVCSRNGALALHYVSRSFNEYIFNCHVTYSGGYGVYD